MRGVKLLTFLVTAHTLLFFIGSAGFIGFQENSNQHREFATLFTDDSKLESEVGNIADQQQSGFLDSVNSIFLSIPIFNQLYQILFGPYVLLANTGLPPVLKILIQAVLGVVEFSVFISFVRGV